VLLQQRELFFHSHGNESQRDFRTNLNSNVFAEPGTDSCVYCTDYLFIALVLQQSLRWNGRLQEYNEHVLGCAWFDQLAHRIWRCGWLQ
jgi:hypothetical protein